MDPLVLLQQRELLLPAADVVVGGAFRQVVPQQVQVVGMAVEPLELRGCLPASGARDYQPLIRP